jgi:hypothetical protein
MTNKHIFVVVGWLLGPFIPPHLSNSNIPYIGFLVVQAFFHQNLAKFFIL